jgi:hypothetical protein
MTVERINLLPDALLTKRAVRGRVRAWLIGGLSAVVLTTGGAAFHVWSSVTPTGDLEAALAGEHIRAEDLRETISARSSIVSELSRDLQMRLRITACPDWSPLLSVIATRVGPRAELSSLVLQPTDSAAVRGSADSAPTSYTLLLSGKTDSARTLSALLLDLERLPVLRRVELVGSRATEEDGGLRRIAFDVGCELRDETIAAVEAPE